MRGGVTVLFLTAACGGGAHDPAEAGAPGDLWMCPCSCSDPAEPGASLIVPQQGCAPTGLDEAVAADRETACAEACAEGDLPCGTSRACLIGGCGAADSADGARRIGAHACDPDGRASGVGGLGDYHVGIEAGTSTMTLTLDGADPLTRPVRGEVYANVDDEVVDVADLELAVDDFAGGGHDFTGLVLFVHDRPFGRFTTAPSFRVFPGLGVIGVRWRWGDAPIGVNVVNRDPWGGTIDPAARRFVLDATGEDPEGGHRLALHLEGTIDSLPPTAAAGTDQTVACGASGTEVTLDASGSSDPDGEAIAHVQWATALGQPLGSATAVTVVAPAGDTTYVVRVYDEGLGAGLDTVIVTCTP